jgi:hypothetical protein
MNGRRKNVAWVTGVVAVSAVIALAGALHAQSAKDTGSSIAATKPAKVDPAMVPVVDDPKLPRVLLIGDSVSVAYTLVVRKELEGVANVHRVLGNGGSTKTALGSYGLERWLAGGNAKWDVIHFNHGLHDACYRFADGSDKDAKGNYASPLNNAKPNVSLDAYEKNLRLIVARLRQTGAKLIFATTTPIPDSQAEKYVKGSEVAYNDIARNVMTEEKIPVNDLWAAVMPQLDKLQIPRNVHFQTAGSAVLGKQVAKSIQNLLVARNTSPDYDFAAMIQPVPATAKFSDPDYYIWCGTMVRGDDGKCHLFYSRWPHKLGFKAWVTHSEVAHAVGDTPLGPFTHKDVALPARGTNFWDGSCTHNPTVIRHRDKFYLYYMGNYGDGVVLEPLNWIHRNNQRIGVAVADSPDGPWQRFDHPVLDISSDPDAPDALMTSNPSVAVRPDGGVLMVYKAVATKRPLPFGGPVSHLVATSDSPTGPFTKHPNPVFVKEGVHFAAEDPFIWSDGQRYWAIVKDNAGYFTGAGRSTALWQSDDGFDWRMSKHPLVATTEIVWADGQKQKMKALERPQLFFENGRPAVLLFATTPDDKGEGAFNVRIPLLTQAKGSL